MKDKVNSALVRARNKIKRPDARIAFAMPTRYENFILSVVFIIFAAFRKKMQVLHHKT
jgi:hypothetical protein